MDTSRNVVKRHQFADYLNTQSADKPNYCLMGVGFTSLNEEPGAQTESKKYVNEKASSKSVTGYETVFPFESDLIPEVYCFRRNLRSVWRYRHSGFRKPQCSRRSD